jgi:hypothetical protein
MSSAQQQAENKPSQPAPAGESKEKMESVIAYAGDKVYEIPMDVASQYESRDSHDQGEDDEVGPYIWITDGRSYRGPHWHPNVNSPFAYDMDNY